MELKAEKVNANARALQYFACVGAQRIAQQIQKEPSQDNGTYVRALRFDAQDTQIARMKKETRESLKGGDSLHSNRKKIMLITTREGNNTRQHEAAGRF